MIPIEVTLDRAGRTPFRLTPDVTALRWTTAAMGGFGSCTFSLPGPPPFWKREIPHLSMLRLVLDTFVIWEGRVEDITMSLLDETTQVQCFGLQRLLDLTSVRRIWSKRDLSLARAPVAFGGKSPFLPADGLNYVFEADISVSTGQFDNSDLSKTGVRIAGNGVAIAQFSGTLVQVIIPGASIASVLGTVTMFGLNVGVGKMIARAFAWTNGSAAGNIDKADVTASGPLSFAPSANRDSIGFGTIKDGVGSVTPVAADTIDYTDLRLLGTSIAEDVSGGYYGGTILRDLIGLVPGLTAGMIDSGSDFTISAIERSVRSASRSVVDEVAGYYTREWRVWEDGRFDWKAINADEPQWIATLDDLDSGSELTATVDGTAETLYILYVDAASGRETEASASSTDLSNPFVKQGQTSDTLVAPGFPMTDTTSAQLSSKLITDQGGYAAVQGRLVLPAMSGIRRATGSPLPAYTIRAGDNIIVADLPKTNLFSQGRDGETLFHIVSTEASLDDGSMILEVEGQTRRTDVLLARLAAATRVITG